MSGTSVGVGLDVSEGAAPPSVALLSGKRETSRKGMTVTGEAGDEIYNR